MKSPPAAPPAHLDRIRSLSLRWKVLIGFGLLFSTALALVVVILTFGIPFTAYTGSYGHEQAQILSHLSLVADLKKEGILLWLDERKEDAATISGDLTAEAFSIERLREVIRKSVESGETNDRLRSAALNEKDSPILHQHLVHALKANEAIHKIQIADSGTGFILASTEDGDVGDRISLQRLLAGSSGVSDETAVDIEKMPPSGRTYLIMSRVIGDRSSPNDNEKSLRALVLLYVDADSFIQPMLYTGEGMGKTGEIILVNQDARIIISLKYPLPDGTTPKVLDYQIKAGPVLLALQGKDGIVGSEDYRGVPVLAAYAHLKVSRNVGWGMVVKQDQSEVFAPLHRMVLSSALIGMFSLTGVALLAIWLANRLSQPVENLIRTAQEVEAGNLDVRAEVTDSDELGALTTTFNSMIERIQHWRRELEDQVKVRTVRLNELNIGLTNEIDERRRVEEALRESEERYRLLVENSLTGVLIHQGGVYVYVNERFAEMTGYPVDELIGRDFLHVVHPEDRDIVRDRATKRSNGEATPPIYEFRLLHKSGDTKWAQVMVATIKRQGSVAIMANMLDITERKKAEEALRESEIRYRSLFDNMNNAVAVYRAEQDGEDFIFADFNAAGEKIDNIDKKEVIGQSVLKMFPGVKEFGLFEVFQRVWRTGEPEYHPVALYRDERIQGWRDNFVYKLSTGEMVVVYRDETERKRAEKALRESEEKHRSILANIEEGYFEVDIAGNMTFCNEPLSRMLGYTKEELIGMNNREYMDANNAKQVYQAFNRVYRTGKPEGMFGWELVRKDGTPKDVEASVSLLKDSEGKPCGFRGVVRDITERKKAEEERESFRKQILQAQKMESIGTLTGGIAHDFNNLLTIMNGYTEMILMDKTEDDPLYADLQKILQTGLKGADMVQRLLSFTKQTATKLEPVDLNHRIQETKKLMDRSFPKTIEIETNLPDDLGMVNADAGQMDQLLMNLCVNARDAMPDGGRLKIETRNITVDEDYCRLHIGAKPGRHVLIEIADTGIGMSKETMDRMFDPFFTTKGWDFKKGTGLGLSVAKGIVEQHDGWMACESEPGKGTTFTVYFPSIKDSPAVRKPEPVAKTVPGNEKILLVDDEEYVRDLGKRILEREGYTVITAANGKEALEIYAKEQSSIALIVLDLIMPQMEGKQCLEELLKINPQVNVIVSTGHSLDARERLLLGSLARGFVNKPYEVGQMVQTVKGVLKAGGHG